MFVDEQFYHFGFYWKFLIFVKRNYHNLIKLRHYTKIKKYKNNFLFKKNNVYKVVANFLGFLLHQIIATFSKSAIYFFIVSLELKIYNFLFKKINI